MCSFILSIVEILMCHPHLQRRVYKQQCVCVCVSELMLDVNMVEKSRRSQRLCPYILLLVLSFWILCLVAFLTRCLKGSLGNQQQSGSVLQDGFYNLFPENAPSAASLRGYQPEPRNGTVEKSPDLPQSEARIANFVGPKYEGALAECCPRPLVDAGCDGFTKSVERLPSASVRKGSLYPDKTDYDSVECLLKTAPVKQAQLFSYQDGWFRYSIMAETALSHPMNVTSEAEAITSFPDPGSTHKWLVILDGGQRAIFKPKW